jgi:folate-dependent phosphoribosylglycinamide formyltransferase PurN
MSQSSTSRHQRRRLHELGLHPALLPAVTDVDTWDDALSVAGLAPDGTFGAVVHHISSALELGLGSIARERAS